MGVVLGNRSVSGVVVRAAPDRAVLGALVCLERGVREAELFCAMLLVCPNGGGVPSRCVFTLPEKLPPLPSPPCATS